MPWQGSRTSRPDRIVVPMPSRSQLQRQRRRRLDDLARAQAGIVSRRPAYALGVTRGEVRAQIRAQRWQRVGHQCVAMCIGPLTREAQWWAAVFEVAGIQHAWVEQIVGDGLRQNSIVLAGDLVLRLPLLGLRVCPDDFFDQIGLALRARAAG
jgi:hypothetical protein